MAGVFGSNNNGRKLSGDSASSLFDDSICVVNNDIATSSSISSLPQRPIGSHSDHFNGYPPPGTLLDGILQNLSILDNNVELKKYCTCADGILATSYCSVCTDYLCDKCVSAHSRVKVTRDHPIQRFNSLDAEPSLTRNSTNTLPLPICDKCAMVSHATGHRVQYLQQVIDESRTILGSLVSQSRSKVDIFSQLSSNILAKIKNLDMQTSDACTEIKNVFRELSALLEQRERELISNVHQTKQMKFQTLNSKFEEVREKSNNLKTLTDSIQRECEFSNGIDIIKAKERLATELAMAERSLAKNAYFDDDPIAFIPPDSTIIATINQLGKVICHSTPLNLAIARPPRTMANEVSNLVIGHHLSRASDAGEYTQKSIKDQSIFLPHQLLEKQDDNLSITKSIAFEDGKQSDLREILRGPQPSQLIRLTKPRFSFGGMGEKDGQLCRPWGVACGKNGNFVVADRSNNRIQIFSSDGIFIRKFGVAGSQPGQFNRPAGLSVDVHNRIVIADKDNHRIQVFSFDGEFLFTFGERGSKNSQFYYPWDIATDSKGLIAVTDTRNHRIQIFDHNGKFIGKYGFEGILWKHFDSPRGIFFTNNDMNLVVTDFNNHRLVIIQSDLQSARFLGSEGCQPSQFMRPQGVAVDAYGNYIVADSRNNRLQIFSPSGAIIVILGGTQGSDSEEMDRPSGVAVTPDGSVAVVDFGNNRVLVY